MRSSFGDTPSKNKKSLLIFGPIVVSSSIYSEKDFTPVFEIKLSASKSNSFLKKKTVIFFWTEKLTSHLIAAHKKIIELKLKHPDYQFIAISLDNNQNEWNSTLLKYNFENSIELRSNNFEDIKAKWAIMKVHRAIVLNSDASIKNAFTNIFDVDFENNLK